ncbi:MAG TPA: hypothetical protein VGS58_12425 [Candidatus Sulfopaludibacter sp.]|nr:hypothetical protein [Candidatus Sulfopaludibacter sp.]
MPGKEALEPGEVRHSAPCPIDRDELAEARSMGAIGGVPGAAFEEHLRVCGRCRTAAERAGVYVQAMRSASRLISLSFRRS